MATNEGFDGDPGGGFSHLLESGGGEVVGLDLGGESFIYSSSFPSLKPPTMLCFGNVCSKNERGEKIIINKQKSRTITGINSDSSSASSSNNSSCSNSIIITKSKRSQIGGELKTEHERRNGSGQDFDIVPVLGSGNVDENRRTSKKPKKDIKPISTAPVKVRRNKEKLGERITALQQLVSPFGKTDTASVLHEAMGYIRFLHDQVQVLSSPYLQSMPSSSTQEGGRRRTGGGGGGGDDDEEEEDEKVMMKMKRSSSCCDDDDGGGVDDLRSRGLCLVPVEYTVHVADCNGADLWSPAAASHGKQISNHNSSTTTTGLNH